MERIKWDSLAFDEKEKQLILVDQNLKYIPLSVINLYGDRATQIDLSWNRIVSLESLRLFPKLETVVLDNNNLTDEVFQRYNANQCPLVNVKTLSLNNNKLEKLSLLVLLLANDFPNLEHISLLGNPLCPFMYNPEAVSLNKYNLYRNEIAAQLAKLRFLDHTRIVRPFTGTVPQRHPKVLKYSTKMITAKFKPNSENIYSPLPNTIRVPGDHCGIYGVRKGRYVGKHSEGNRFIFNSDL